jgi:HPt (histidine-containing phosphotransfer) domain-containing protein
MMTPSPIDPPTFEDLQQTAGIEFVRELIDTFLAEAPAMLASLDHSRAAGNAADFRRAAHSLKSNSNTFGALALGALARDMELGDMAAVPAAGAGSLEALRIEYARVVEALTELRDA